MTLTRGPRGPGCNQLTLDETFAYWLSRPGHINLSKSVCISAPPRYNTLIAKSYVENYNWYFVNMCCGYLNGIWFTQYRLLKGGSHPPSIAMLQISPNALKACSNPQRGGGGDTYQPKREWGHFQNFRSKDAIQAILPLNFRCEFEYIFSSIPFKGVCGCFPRKIFTI